jgi:tetratricopeptide (TPR) repeat protein
MRIAAVLVIAAALFPAAGPALGADQKPAQLYNEANNLYILKQYQEALSLYRELVDRGIEHPHLFYNLANTYYKLGRKGEAVLYYERALRLSPLDREIRSNLRFVKKSLDDQITPLYNEGFALILETAASIFTLNVLAYLEVGLFVLFVGLFIAALLVPAYRSSLRSAAIVIGVFFVIAFAGLLLRLDQLRDHPHAVIMAEQIEVRSSPISESDVVFTLHEGTGIRVIEQRGDWVRFQLRDGREGWLPFRDIELIEPDVLL